MRLVWILALLLALLPERLGWGLRAGECCAENCTCAAADEPSCCETPAGPVIVALCGCGAPHEARRVERLHYDWFASGARLGLARLAEARWSRAEPSALPASRREAPEPPPPRQGI